MSEAGNNEEELFEMQPLWANSEKLIPLMADLSRRTALTDLKYANAQPLGALRINVADELRRYFEPAATLCRTPAEVHGLRPGQLFVYRGVEMHCKGMHYVHDASKALARGRIRIGSASSPHACEGQARLTHSLVNSVDSLGMKARKYLLGARTQGRGFIPLIAGLFVLQFDSGDKRPSPPRYKRQFRHKPAEFADLAIETLRREVELGHTWKLFRRDGPENPGEATLQTVFELICNVASTDYDISVDPQADHGAGTVDLCISAGAIDPCCIELKVSTHDRITHGLKKQLPAYMKAKRSTIGRFVVLCIDGGAEPSDVEQLLHGVSIPDGLTVETVIIDGRTRRSASRL